MCCSTLSDCSFILIVRCISQSSSHYIIDFADTDRAGIAVFDFAEM